MPLSIIEMMSASKKSGNSQLHEKLLSAFPDCMTCQSVSRYLNMAAFNSDDAHLKMEPQSLPLIHAFRPFFTRQPNAQTYATQKATWENLILNYYRSNRLWRIDVNQETIEKIPIFSNKQIQSIIHNGAKAHARENEAGFFTGVGEWNG